MVTMAAAGADSSRTDCRRGLLDLSSCQSTPNIELSPRGVMERCASSRSCSGDCAAYSATPTALVRLIVKRPPGEPPDQWEGAELFITEHVRSDVAHPPALAEAGRLPLLRRQSLQQPGEIGPLSPGKLHDIEGHPGRMAALSRIRKAPPARSAA